MSNEKTPAPVVLRLLSLAEFMEHEEKSLPFEASTLGSNALRVQAFAKALHYKELEWFNGKSSDIIHDLIEINTKLQQRDAAWGTLIVAQKLYDVTNHEEWYERLGRWPEALMSYERKTTESPGEFEFEFGRMKCLHAIGEWDQLASQINQNWAYASADDRSEMAPMAANAAWSLHQVTLMPFSVSKFLNLR